MRDVPCSAERRKHIRALVLAVGRCLVGADKSLQIQLVVQVELLLSEVANDIHQRLEILRLQVGAHQVIQREDARADVALTEHLIRAVTAAVQVLTNRGCRIEPRAKLLVRRDEQIVVKLQVRDGALRELSCDGRAGAVRRQCSETLVGVVVLTERVVHSQP